MIKVDEDDPVGELEESFPYRDVKIRKGEDVKKYYDLEGELGRGKFGTVYKCKEKGSKLILAAKFIHIERRQDRQNVEREVELMRKLQHPRLIQLYDAFETDNIMCVVLELIEGGELFERVIDDDFVLTEKACTAFMRQICEGVEFIHRNNIIHLDLKPENILCLTKTGNRIKIIDFGLARKYEPDKKLQVLFGTPEFVAPEVVNFDQISFATDMWSVGVICYVLLSGLSPFMGETDIETMSNVTLGLFDFDDESFDEISADAKDFISKLLIKNQKFRMSAMECLIHPWLKKRPPKKPVPCLDPSKEKLKTYVENFTPHSGIKFINKIDETEKFLTPFKEIDKDVNPIFTRAIRKDPLITHTGEKLTNGKNYPEQFSKSQQVVPYKRYWEENIYRGNGFPQDIYGEKAVRHKLTLTPIVRNILPNNLIQENPLVLQPDHNTSANNLIEGLSNLPINDTDKKQNILQFLTTFNENTPMIQQKNNDLEKSDKKDFNFIDTLEPILSGPIHSSYFDKKSIKPDTNSDVSISSVKERIIIPTAFGGNGDVKINQNLPEVTSVDVNNELIKSDISKDEHITDFNWPDLFVKMTKNIEPNYNLDNLNSNYYRVRQMNNLQNSPNNNNISVKNTLKKFEQNFASNITMEEHENIDDKKYGVNRKFFGEEVSVHTRNSCEFKGRKKSMDATFCPDLLTTVKGFTTVDSINPNCSRVTALPPIISIAGSKKKIEQKDTSNGPLMGRFGEFLEKKPLINYNHRNSLDSQNTIKYRLDSITLQNNDTNENEFFKTKLKSTPPWFSEMQKPNITNNDIPQQRRSKFKFSAINRDVPLNTPIKSDIEKYLGINSQIRTDNKEYLNHEKSTIRRASYNNTFDITIKENNVIGKTTIINGEEKQPGNI